MPMSTPREPQPPAKDDKPKAPAGQESGTNEVEHQPDDSAEPIPDSGSHRYIPPKPYTTGNY
jgi:hypothetical protein